MALRTAFTELLRIVAPVALAPMAGSAGGALAAAVSSAGGLGLIGGGLGERTFLERELAIVGEQTDKPWGVGFVSWPAPPASVELALTRRPAAVMLSFGDPAPLARLVLAAGVRLIVQVTDLEEARRAIDLGADVLVAQGAGAGGHAGRRATLPFVPAVEDLAGTVPVLAAGGIADGRGIAAALCLGASGALLGTRFHASAEALAGAVVAQAIVLGAGEDTEQTRLVDIARGTSWPSRYPGRCLRNAFLEHWRGREEALDGDEPAKAGYRRAVAAGDPAKAGYRRAVAAGDPSVVPVWASEAIDLITSAPPAGELVARLVADAEAALTRAGRAART